MLEEKKVQVPWTIQQTFQGIFYTLAPWIALAIVLSGFGAKAAPTKPLAVATDISSAMLILLFSTLVEGAFLIAPLYFAYRAFRALVPRARLAWRALGFRGFSVGRAIAWIIILILAILTIDNLYQFAINYFHLNVQTNDQLILQTSKSAPYSTYATLIVAVFVAPICEEIFFRGFVFTGLLQGMPTAWAILFSSLIFAVAHADPGSFAVLFFIGLALAFLRWRTNSLWPGIILHFTNNGLGALVIILTMQGVLK